MQAEEKGKAPPPQMMGWHRKGWLEILPRMCFENLGGLSEAICVRVWSVRALHGNVMSFPRLKYCCGFGCRSCSSSCGSPVLCCGHCCSAPTQRGLPRWAAATVGPSAPMKVSQMRGTLTKGSVWILGKKKKKSKVRRWILLRFFFFILVFLLEEAGFLSVRITVFVSPVSHLVCAVWPRIHYWCGAWRSLIHATHSQIDLGSSWQCQATNIHPKQARFQRSALHFSDTWQACSAKMVNW